MEVVLMREKLYEQVWKEPMGELARRLGVTSAKLRAACKVMAIPIPALAHWSAVKSGRESIRPPLLPHDGQVQFRISPKEKESLVDWVLRAAPPQTPHKTPPRKTIVAPTQSTQVRPRLVPLQVWADSMFGEHAPHSNTLLRWVHEGRIQPQPKKIARKWWVAPGAEYCED